MPPPGFEPPPPALDCLLVVGCLSSQHNASVSPGRIYSDNFTCCHTEIGVADQTFYLTQSQYTDTELTSASADPITPGTWQGSHWSASCLSHRYDSTRKNPRRQRDSNPGSSRGGRLNHLANEAVSALETVTKISAASLTEWVRGPPRERQTGD